MTIREFDRNFILSSMIAGRGIQSLMVFLSIQNDEPKKSAFIFKAALP